MRGFSWEYAIHGKCMKGKLAVVVFSDKVRELITKREACYDEWGK
jgi:hypothetical protein